MTGFWRPQETGRGLTLVRHVWLQRLQNSPAGSVLSPPCRLREPDATRRRLEVELRIEATSPSFRSAETGRDRLEPYGDGVVCGIGRLGQVEDLDPGRGPDQTDQLDGAEAVVRRWAVDDYGPSKR